MLQEIVDDLQEKGQVIFLGAAGDGQDLRRPRSCKAVRTHGGRASRSSSSTRPTAYEDFVEGYRPRLTESGQAGFELVQGPLRRIAEKAAAKPDAKFISGH